MVWLSKEVGRVEEGRLEGGRGDCISASEGFYCLFLSHTSRCWGRRIGPCMCVCGGGHVYVCE